MAVNLRDMRTITSFLCECKKFEFIDGVPTLTVSLDLMNEIRDAIALENLCRVGVTSREWTDYERVTAFGVVINTSYAKGADGGGS